MNRLSTLFLLLFLWSVSVSAQDFTIFNQVIGSTGHFAVEGNQQWTYTVGEVVIETMSANNRALTQGFHQPEFARPVSTIDPELLSWNIEVFPNPTADVLNVRFDSNQSGLLEAIVFDMYGRMLMQPQSLDLATGSVIDCTTWLPGVYILQLRDQQSRASATFRFIRL
jgi:Secretion system C-terminal sorting domain